MYARMNEVYYYDDEKMQQRNAYKVVTDMSST